MTDIASDAASAPPPCYRKIQTGCDWSRAKHARDSDAYDGGRLMRTFFAAAILLVAMPAAAHDWYSAERSPNGGSCCGSKDCRMLTSDEIRLTEAGELEVLELGTWWPALDPLWYIGPSPDGSFHLCRFRTDKKPRCVFGGLGT